MNRQTCRNLIISNKHTDPLDFINQSIIFQRIPIHVINFKSYGSRNYFKLIGHPDDIDWFVGAYLTINYEQN